MLKSWSSWLEKTPVSHAIQDAGWVIPACQVVHILCLALVLSAIVFINVRLLGLGPRRLSAAALAKRFMPQVWGGVVVMAFTGSILVIAEPGRDLTNLVFQTKMALLLAALATSLGIQRRLNRNPDAWGGVRSGWPARGAALLSLGLWITIAVCGRFIAYFMA